MDYQNLPTTPSFATNPLYLLPPEIRSQIFSSHISSHFEDSPCNREIIYQATESQSWAEDWRANPDVCELPPLERALVGDRKLHRECFVVRVAMSVVVIRPSECIDHSLFVRRRGSGRGSRCFSEAKERTNIRYPVLGRHISPLVIRNAREFRYLTYVHNPLLDEICIDKNAVSEELGKSLIELGRWSDAYTPTLRLLTIVFRAPFVSALIARFPVPKCFCSSSSSLTTRSTISTNTNCLLANHSQYALYWKNYEYERAMFWDGIEILVKKRGVNRLQLKRDDGQGWRGKGPDFGMLGEDLNMQLGVLGEVELVDDCSNIKFNRIVYPFTGVSESWSGVNGRKLVWMED